MAFSDIHYADYSTGVTAADCAAVERAVTSYALEVKASFCVFCGDRYLSHEPQDYIRVISDLEQKHRNDSGLVTFSLVGNHDLYAKAPVSGHSNRHLQTVWGEFLPNIIVMDEVRTYQHPKVPGVLVHAIPACFGWRDDLLANFDFRPDQLNLLVFHDLLKGAVLDCNSGYKAPKGQRIDLIDDDRFQLVLGGDVHITQRLDFKRTSGGYVGAAIQQSRRDRGECRGWTSILTDDVSRAVVHMESVEGPSPRFLDITWDLDLQGALPSASVVEQQLRENSDDTAFGNIVDVVLVGSRSQIEAVPVGWHLDLQKQLGARRVNSPIKRARAAAVMPQHRPSSACRAPLEDLHTYLASGRVSLDGNDPSRLLEKASSVLSQLGGVQ